VTLPCGESVPALGQGTWRIGDGPSRRREEIDCLRRGIDLGLCLTLIDAAEIYGEGLSEALVGEAIDLYLLHRQGDVSLAETVEAAVQTDQVCNLGRRGSQVPQVRGLYAY
jgi:diketogulonate reductase-like aldo/keto reductase